MFYYLPFDSQALQERPTLARSHYNILLYIAHTTTSYGTLRCSHYNILLYVAHTTTSYSILLPL
jgi:hypothetical protein